MCRLNQALMTRGIFMGLEKHGSLSLSTKFDHFILMLSVLSLMTL